MLHLQYFQCPMDPFSKEDHSELVIWSTPFLRSSFRGVKFFDWNGVYFKIFIILNRLKEGKKTTRAMPSHQSQWTRLGHCVMRFRLYCLSKSASIVSAPL
ncbi:hypothetical protein OUZ56_019402 [Daphnia magna]|uniref:Uncharacterized protein n=1 Tax=Daphnia magna TaxID=35525 RepID=A0ABQ9ZC89_9CRUS|nr:hypothetical protein OUZ56_019402 [Daphnia magna]